MRFEAILVAGDRGASRAVRGISKAFVEIAGKPMVVHVLEALLHTPEVSEVYLVGNPARLSATVAAYGCLALSASNSLTASSTNRRCRVMTPKLRLRFMSSDVKLKP